MSGEQVYDYTKTLEFLASHIMAGGCAVALTPSQFKTLKEYLVRVEDLGEGVNFRLEACVNHAPGCSLIWDNGGTDEQDHAVDRLMDELVVAMGFVT